MEITLVEVGPRDGLQNEKQTVDVATKVDAARARVAALRESGFRNPYGDGRAGERIADIIVHALTGTERRTKDWPGP